MSLISIPYTFTVGAVIVASQHNSNFSTIYSDYNGNITDDNIAANAAISDSKLAQITTAGKVSGASLILLGSTPSGAGILPSKNGGTGGDMSAAAQGAVPYFSNTGIQSALSAGTSGYYLQSQGAAQNPQWAFTGFGAYVSKVATTIYQAATDGLLLGSVQTDDSNYFEVRSDSNATPTTVRMAVGNGTSTTTNVRVGFCCPIIKNNYYRIIAQGSGDVSTLEYCFFIPLGS